MLGKKINAGFEKRDDLVILTNWHYHLMRTEDWYHGSSMELGRTFSRMILSTIVRKSEGNMTANLTQPFWLPGRACRSRYIRIPYFLPHSILNDPLLIKWTTDSSSRSLRLQKIAPRSSGQEGFVAHSFNSPEPYWYPNPIETRSYVRQKRVVSSRRWTVQYTPAISTKSCSVFGRINVAWSTWTDIDANIQ